MRKSCGSSGQERTPTLFFRPCESSGVSEGAKFAVLSRQRNFAGSDEPQIKSGRLPKQGHVRYILDRWKVSCDDDSTASDIKWKAFISRDFDEEAPGP